MDINQLRNLTNLKRDKEESIFANEGYRMGPLNPSFLNKKNQEHYDMYKDQYEKEYGEYEDPMDGFVSLRKILEEKIVDNAKKMEEDSNTLRFERIKGLEGRKFDLDDFRGGLRSGNTGIFSSNSYGILQGKPGDLMKTLGTKTTEYGGSTKFESFHPAIDIANTKGTPIPSFTPGIVTKIVTGKVQGDKGYGNYIIVTDANGFNHRYSHLDAIGVVLGDHILQGQIIGKMGNSGSTYSTSGGDGTHLDYRIADQNGKHVNPYSYLSNY